MCLFAGVYGSVDVSCSFDFFDFSTINDGNYATDLNLKDQVENVALYSWHYSDIAYPLHCFRGFFYFELSKAFSSIN